MNKFREKLLTIFYRVKGINWIWSLCVIISIEASVIITLHLILNQIHIDTKDALEIILVYNGLFSAILITYFFNRLTRVYESKKSVINDAVLYSQKITDLRRIFKTLTDYYNVWVDDNATKSLFYGKFKNIDYFDFKLSSISDYEGVDPKLQEELYNNPNYKEGMSDLYLGMISLVEDRKLPYREFDETLHYDFQTKDVYTLSFISKCVEIDYLGRLGYWFDRDYNLIKYNNLSLESRNSILEALKRIDYKKYQESKLNNQTMGEICKDMNSYYFKQLHEILIHLEKGLSWFNQVIYFIVILCLVFGVLMPFLTYFVFEDSTIKQNITKCLIGINFGLLCFFIFNLRMLVQKEIRI